MKISNNKNNNNGFTLIELVVVIAGLAALSSFSIPSVLNSMRLNRIDEAKAMMNGYAADCLAKYRISTDPLDFIENSTPDDLDNTKLSTLGYVIDGDKNKCSNLAIKPSNDDEKNLYAFDFSISSEGRVIKTGTPSSNPSFLNSCRGWAGKYCGLSDAQKAEFARLAAIAKAKSECLSNYSQWLSAGSSGENISWDSSGETCTRSVFAFEGIPVNSLEAVNQALDAKYGRLCLDWRESKKNSISPNGNPQTKNPECGGVQYWFHSGNIFTTQAMWDAHDNLLKQQSCIKNRTDALDGGVKGKYTYTPAGPPPCGQVAWLCNGEEYGSLEAYESTTCGTPAPNPGPTPPPAWCKGFSSHSICKDKRWLKRNPNHPLCICS